MLESFLEVGYTKTKLQEQEMNVSLNKATSVAFKTRNMLFVVMEQCKVAQKNDLFVQDVTCAPEPMAVLCNEQLLIEVLLPVIQFLHSWN